MIEETAKLYRIRRVEVMHALGVSIVIAFVLTFRDWGEGESVDLTAGLSALILCFIIALGVLLLRMKAQKWIAVRLGYFTGYSVNKIGTATSILLAFFTFGLFPYISPGSLEISESKRLRLGAYRYGLNMRHLALISLAGPAVSILLMFIIKPFALANPENFFLHKVIVVNAAIAFFSLIPLPGTEGFHVFYFRRWLWVFCLFFVGTYFAMILWLGLFSYVVAVVLASFALYIYNAHIE